MSDIQKNEIAIVDSEKLSNEIHPICQDDRNGDGSLKETAKERACLEIAKYISKRGYVDVVAIAGHLKVQPITAKSLIRDVVDNWREEDADFMTAHKRWLQNIMIQIDENPEIFDDKKIALIELKNMLAGQIFRISRLERGELSMSEVDELLNFRVIWSRTLKPKTRRLLEEKLKENENIEQSG